MTLKELVDELGVAEVARRLKVDTRTLNRWIRQGVAQRERERIQRIIDNQVARKYPTPEGPWEDKPGRNWLPPEALRPKNAPHLDENGVGVLAPGETLLLGAFPGRVLTIAVEKPVFEVEIWDLFQRALKYWKQSRQPMFRIVLIAMRMIARWNPLYRGEMLKKQGTWQQWAPSQTAIWATADDMWDDVERKFDDILDEAKRRPHYLMQFQIHVFRSARQAK